MPAESAVAKARDQLVSLLEEHEIADAGALERVVAEDTTQAVIERTADYDLVLIGAATKTALAGALFGSKTETIAADAKCSVLVARAGV